MSVTESVKKLWYGITTDNKDGSLDYPGNVENELNDNKPSALLLSGAVNTEVYSSRGFIVSTLTVNPKYNKPAAFKALMTNVTANGTNDYGFGPAHLGYGLDLALNLALNGTAVNAEKTGFYLNNYGTVLKVDAAKTVGTARAIALLHDEHPKVVTCDGMSKLFLQNDDFVASAKVQSNLPMIISMLRNYQHMNGAKHDAGCSFDHAAIANKYAAPDHAKVQPGVDAYIKGLENKEDDVDSAHSETWLNSHASAYVSASVSATPTPSPTPTPTVTPSVAGEGEGTPDSHSSSGSVNVATNASVDSTKVDAFLTKSLDTYNAGLLASNGFVKYSAAMENLVAQTQNKKDKESAVKDFYKAVGNLKQGTTAVQDAALAAVVHFVCSQTKDESVEELADAINKCSLNNSGSQCLKIKKGPTDEFVIRVSAERIDQKCPLEVIRVERNAETGKASATCVNDVPFSWGASTVQRMTAFSKGISDHYATLVIFEKAMEVLATPGGLCETEFSVLTSA